MKALKLTVIALVITASAYAAVKCRFCNGTGWDKNGRTCIYCNGTGAQR